MNLITIFNQFPDRQSCIAHLEAIRWPEKVCPLCGSERVARKVEKGRQGRWIATCTSSFRYLEPSFNRLKFLCKSGSFRPFVLSNTADGGAGQTVEQIA